jgi:hypothetical protein
MLSSCITILDFIESFHEEPSRGGKRNFATCLKQNLEDTTTNGQWRYRQNGVTCHGATLRNNASIGQSCPTLFSYRRYQELAIGFRPTAQIHPLSRFSTTSTFE